LKKPETVKYLDALASIKTLRTFSILLRKIFEALVVGIAKSKQGHTLARRAVDGEIFPQDRTAQVARMTVLATSAERPAVLYLPGLFVRKIFHDLSNVIGKPKGNEDRRCLLCIY